jgi:hypothetical protein
LKGDELCFTGRASGDHEVREQEEYNRKSNFCNTTLPTGFSSSFSEKQANRLGDKVSVALLKIYSKEEMENPENIKVFLPVIRSAFLYPNLLPAGDREPRVTLPLLARLEKNVGNPELKRDIGTVISSIKEQTSKSKRNRP